MNFRRSVIVVELWQPKSKNAHFGEVCCLLPGDNRIDSNDNLMAVLCGMPTTKYSTGSGPLSVHKLFTSCIGRCLVSHACD